MSWSCCPSSCRSRSGVSLRPRRSRNRNFRRHGRWRTSFFVRVSPWRSGRNSRRRWRRGPWAGCRPTSTCWGCRNRRRLRRSRRSREPFRQPTRHSRCRCRRRFPRRERRYSGSFPSFRRYTSGCPFRRPRLRGRTDASRRRYSRTLRRQCRRNRCRGRRISPRRPASSPRSSRSNDDRADTLVCPRFRPRGRQCPMGRCNRIRRHRVGMRSGRRGRHSYHRSRLRRHAYRYRASTAPRRRVRRCPRG